ncbi:MAG TPA: hypothetical protein VHR88_04450 [Solirubrobacteraceae bacterium]|jgi:hypothetical protein|nr:hypothetical protein [Solirubrobacteraceae bacterium]
MGPLIEAIKQKFGGDGPSALRALMAAVIAGLIVGVATYKALRS